MKISLFISSLPTHNTTARMRVWRSLKACGAATLRDGVYLLPRAYSEKFEPIANDVISEQGSAYIFDADPASNLDLSTIFNRKEEYDALYKQLTTLKDHLTQNEKKELLKHVRKLRKSVNTLVEIDYFPDKTQAKVLNELSALELAIARLGEVNEPKVIQIHIQILDKANYQKQFWATRKRPWIDRLASAWLIQKFIDQSPTFLWLDTPSDCPKEALGFDFDGANFTHTESQVTFEVLIKSFDIQNSALNKIAEIVHYLDVGGNEPPEAFGFEKVIHGLKTTITDDDQLLALSNHIFEGLYADLLGEQDGK